ncbi:exodeoxyribonuclease V subunit gamma [Thiolapillus sp.]
MLNVYPSNRLEDLAQLLDAVLHTPKDNLLRPDIVLVQNGGMQHWLNLQLARQRGISMNLDFHLPASFFWQIIREVLGREAVPDLSPYSREVMCWRLYALLADPVVTGNPLCRDASDYWRAAPGNADSLRFQLARELADLFEQYLIYRPDWIKDWDRGETPHWQAFVWRQLVSDLPSHPLRLLRRTAEQLDNAAAALPPRLCIFGINALAPLWLEFLGKVARHTQVHLFQLNPCVEYWGDARSEKQLSRWLGSDEHELEINPLLGNLGAQGREFLSLLQEQPTTEYAAFDPPLQSAASDTLLHHLQMDIFGLEDARRQPRELHDDSITLVSAHSALREVQGLHDWLLHQFNADASLTPADVLVTCPQIEDYAPAVQAVFGNGWQGENDALTLPCSIADRALRDEEPLVAAFAELLDLPDSRFQVSQILGLLRLPSVQQQFGLTDDDLPVIEGWLEHAAVHWGLDDRHKKQILEVEHPTASYTWQQGLERLLLGFAWGHEAVIYDDRLLLPDVEGEEALLLGRLLQLVEGLKSYALKLGKPRSASAWQTLLSGMQEWLFSLNSEDEQAQQIIASAIDELGEHTQAAGFDQDIPLPVIRDWLRAGFSRPEPGRQFLVGQVSFCSMIPMRSVPFRIIAVLGLNDGAFPRQRPQRGFDLMAGEMPRPGDRSLRGDDRYLFLETLISAREKLYLSFQGRDIKTNQAREPSLVLRELMDYLEQGYGWKFSAAATDIIQLPLQPFSPDNYLPKTGRAAAFHSFDAGWLALLQNQGERNNTASLSFEEDGDKELQLDTLLRFFDHPPRYFAHQQLGLYLGDDERGGPEDHEPFTANNLDRYLLQQQLVQCHIDGEADEVLLQQARLSGHLPENPLTGDMLQEWRQQADDFAAVVAQKGAAEIALEHAELSIGEFRLSAALPRVGDELLFYRLASAKGKDDMRLWLHHLFAHCVPGAGKGIVTRGIFRHGRKADKFSQIVLQPLADAEALLGRLLAVWRQGRGRPLLCGAELGKRWVAALADEPGKFPAFWADDYKQRGPAHDPYYHWFWPDMPSWEELPGELLDEIYQPLYASRTEEDL